MEDVQLRALYVAAPDDEYEFFSLREAEEAAGIEIGDDLRQLLDDDCVSCFLVQDHLPIPPVLNRRFSGTPAEHRGASIIASYIMLKTFDQRDPVLVIDAQQLFLMFLMPPQRMEEYIFARYRENVPLAEPPANKYERWVVSIAASGSLLRRGVGLVPDPSVGRA